MPTLLVAGCHGNFIAEPIKAYLEDERYPLFCSRSLLETVGDHFPQFNTSRWNAIVPLDGCLDRIETLHDAPGVIVLTSGDPLFYGIGKRLGNRFPDWSIRFFPTVSYMQSCFSHFGINWDDARFLSLHGRPLALLDTKLQCPKLFLFTDPENTPNRIAGYLRDRLGEFADSRTMMVGERLGSEEERFSEGTLDEIHQSTFRQPNCVIIVDKEFEKRSNTARFGLREEEIVHSRGLITKSEVRAAVLHRLRLPETGVFWDLGAGSGSISVEAARLYPSLGVYAVEKQQEQLANILANVARFGCPNVVIVSGEAPETLSRLPSPDVVFIGGSGGRLEDILTFLSRTVKDTTRIVLTAVLEQTVRRAPEILTGLNYRVEMSRISVSRFDYQAKNTVELNPIHLIQAEKSCNNEHEQVTDQR